jgi:hypothetical protein
MGLLTRIFRLSGLTHGRRPILFSESSQSGTNGTKPHQQPPSAWQVGLGLENLNLSYCGEVAECSVLSKIIDQVPRNTS